MVKVTEAGLEVAPGINVPWGWVDKLLSDMIEKADAGVLTDPAIANIDNILQKLVDNTKIKFDNVGKAKLEKAFTLSMVKKFMPELLENPL